jgi:uncharacterized protein (DUF433 family)
MTLPDFLHADEYGEIFLAGHRITLYHLLKDYRQGCPAEQLAAAYPTLSLALVEKVLAFYRENGPEVEQYLKETRAEIERQTAAPPRGPSREELQRRSEAKRKAESA